MDPPTTSAAADESQRLELENIGPETMKLLKRMLWKFEIDPNSTTKVITLSDPVSRTARYTGMNRINIEKILAFGDSLKLEYSEIDRRVIHSKLMSMYDKKYIPTISELFNALHEKLPIYVDINYFTKILIKMGYVFYKFPMNKSLRVLEKKTVTFERYRYLKSIQRYRKDNVPIVYIGVTSISRSTGFMNSERALRTDPKNILSHVFFTATAKVIENIQVIRGTTGVVLQDAVKNWLLEIFVLQKLPAGSVCVLEDSKIFRETLIDVPTLNSLKADMVEWLEAHNIPCHIDKPKAELLQLIETCTDTKENTFVIDNLVKTLNYSVLRLPQCINGLSIISLIVRCIKDKSIKEALPRVDPTALLHSLNETDLSNFSKLVQLEEIKQLEEDIKLDNVLDELFRIMKTSQLDVVDDEDDVIIPYFSDSD